MSEEPEGIDASWKFEGDDITVVLKYGNATVTLQHPTEDAEDAVTLVQALPQALDAVAAAIAKEDDQEAPSDPV